MTRQELLNKAQAQRELKIRNSRTSFWIFCKTMNPKVYKNTKLYLKDLCDTLQGIYEETLLKLDGTPYKKLQINMPPGFAKSYTMILFAQWCFGKNKENEIITVSYNEKVTSKFGQAVRNGIEQQKDETKLEISYNHIFPEIHIKYGDASKRDWTLEGRHHSYLATSFRGTLTSMRGNICIVDDPVKNAEEAFNENILEETYTWYTDTFLSRQVEGAIQIVVQTRWSTKDLCGRLLEAEPDDWYVVKYEAMNEDTDEMLCEELMSKKTYDDKKKLMSLEIFMANYHQLCLDIKGKLYPVLQEYTTLPDKFEKIISTCDSSDTGNDYTAAIIAGIYKGQIYVLDIYYTQEAMEITEIELAKRLNTYMVQRAIIESNNGGRGFARNVERLLWDNHKNRVCKVEWYHQSENKISRILSNATNVMNNVFWPVGWKQKYKEAYDSMNSYQRQGKNKHDDLQDTATVLIEKGLKNTAWAFA
jgi:predicted phage terminase large subunit-like protein